MKCLGLSRLGAAYVVAAFAVWSVAKAGYLWPGSDLAYDRYLSAMAFLLPAGAFLAVYDMYANLLVFLVGSDRWPGWIAFGWVHLQTAALGLGTLWLEVAGVERGLRWVRAHCCCTRLTSANVV